MSAADTITLTRAEYEDLIDARDHALAMRDIADGTIETLTGADVAAIWTKVLGRPIAYGGDDTVGFELNLRKFMPSWMAFDMPTIAPIFGPQIPAQETTISAGKFPFVV